jgi:formate-dependent nitrite reductase membrane component NrfD
MLAVFLLAVAGFCMTNSTLVTVLAMAVGLSAGAAVVIYGACAGGK